VSFDFYRDHMLMGRAPYLSLIHFTYPLAIVPSVHLTLIENQAHLFLDFAR